MWCLVYTETEIEGSRGNPAVYDIETYATESDAEKAMRTMYSDKVGRLSGELEYSEFDDGSRTAKIYGEVAVIVMGVMEIKQKKKCCECGRDLPEGEFSCYLYKGKPVCIPCEEQYFHLSSDTSELVRDEEAKDA